MTQYFMTQYKAVGENFELVLDSNWLVVKDELTVKLPFWQNKFGKLLFKLGFFKIYCLNLKSGPKPKRDNFVTSYEYSCNFKSIQYFFFKIKIWTNKK